ncbi:MAG: integrase arm-type DNA-binding domain-containing protein [Methylocella sp.]
MEKRLTVARVAAVSKSGNYPDGGGLYLQATESPDGRITKSWIFRFKSPLTRKERMMGLGSLDRVPLPDARKKRDAARDELEAGRDPIAEKDKVRAQAREIVAEETAPTFDACALAYVKANKAAWKSTKHADQWTATLRRYASPVFGSKPVSEVDHNLVWRVVEPLWSAKPVTASRVRGRIETVLNFAKVRGYRTGENPAAWKGNLSNALPRVSKINKVKHLEAMPYEELPKFYKSIMGEDGSVSAALRLTILTAVRTNEVNAAKWSEIDFEQAIWTIPSDRMKMGKEHRVPLAEEAIAVLNLMKASRVNEFVFPGRFGKRIGNVSMLQYLRGHGVADATVHGFRSSFRDWCGEETSFPREIAEAALAHASGDATERAYRRGDALEKRRALMGEWAAYLVG